jgi:hypothetical protein
LRKWVTTYSGDDKEDITQLVENVISGISEIQVEPTPMPGDIVEKEGYVWTYRLHLERNPAGGPVENRLNAKTYFKVIISSDPEKQVNPKEFLLVRDIISENVDYSGSIPFAITWAPVSMAIIASLKDAFIHKKKVKVIGQYFSDTYGWSGPFIEITTIDMMNP